MTFAPFDIVSGILLVVLAVRGSIVGFVQEFFSMAALILGAIFALVFFRDITPYVMMVVGGNAFPSAIAFLLIFIVSYLVVKAIQRVIGSAIEGQTIGNLDRALGFFLGLLEGAVVSLLLLMIARSAHGIVPPEFLSGSIINHIASPLIDRGSSIIFNFMRSTP